METCKGEKGENVKKAGSKDFPLIEPQKYVQPVNHPEHSRGSVTTMTLVTKQPLKYLVKTFQNVSLAAM